MSDRAVVAVVRLASAIGAVLAVGGSIVVLAAGHGEFWIEEYLPSFTLIAVGLGGFAWLLITSQPRNATVWIMSLAGFTSGVFVAGYASLPFLSEPDPSEVILAAPADLPRSVLLVLLVTAPGWAVGLGSLTTFGLLLFPDGRLPSRRWRPVAWLTGATLAGLMIAYTIALRPSSTTFADDDPMVETVIGVHLVTIVLAVAGLVVRFRRSQATTREQFKWVTWGMTILVLSYLVIIFVDRTSVEPVGYVTFGLGVMALVVSYGIAVGRYRLFDVDLVISRTLVYGALAGFIAGVYVAAVVGAGRLLGGSGEPNTALAIVATAAVAVAFQPLRRRLQRAADRLVYGRRATHHQVLSDFSRRVAATEEALLEQVARSLVDGTGADRVAVWIGADTRMVKAAQWPPDTEVNGELEFPVAQDGVVLGRLTVAVPPGQHLSDADHRLVERMASALALVLRNRALTATLQTRVDELRESRRRLVAAQDDTRRRIERDLHDGAQQQLVALKIKLGLGQAMAEKEGANCTAARLRELVCNTDGAIDAMRDFARGVYPPLLEAEGLTAAVGAHLRRQPGRAGLAVEGVARYGRDIEATVYFCIVESVHQLGRECDADLAVRLTDDQGVLTFEVTGGSTIDVDDEWLLNITDRVDAASGMLTLVDDADRGSGIRGAIPVALAGTGATSA